jgi:hypothetical protein
MAFRWLIHPQHTPSDYLMCLVGEGELLVPLSLQNMELLHCGSGLGVTKGGAQVNKNPQAFGRALRPGVLADPFL